MDSYQEIRKQMVEKQIAARGIQDPRVLEAMGKVPRERFVSEHIAPLAYEDRPLSIDEGQTISQPFIVAVMAQQAQITPQDKVLEIGTGSGYSAAILSQLASHVYSMERYPKLAELAKKRLQEFGYNNVTVSVGDGSLGWEEFAPYEVIIVTAGGPQIPPSLLKQLAISGRLVIPVGPSLESQQLMRVMREDADHYRYENLGSVQFVPLVGKEGWQTTSSS
ncbi:protein-L-isoaspartate(D-aspartate) O-methyltransferase [Candidatus Protochlamydia amoebophila]|nr:protein-L-isoaspartate(D-aspartate) O-methyltransferase [Candidatus Protochlamydia amoebophila]SPJ31722.1 unnamed protein product [Candidatus Protochlamydia amoebophila UWE25]